MTYEVGKEYRTRGGLVATILDMNYKGGGGFKIAGKINIDGREEIITWQSDGSCNILKNSHPYDLMPPVETKELWVNVYPSSGIGDYESKSSADEYAVHSRIGLLKITIAGDDFTVEKVAI